MQLIEISVEPRFNTHQVELRLCERLIYRVAWLTPKLTRWKIDRMVRPDRFRDVMIFTPLFSFEMQLWAR